MRLPTAPLGIALLVRFGAPPAVGEAMEAPRVRRAAIQAHLQAPGSGTR